MIDRYRVFILLVFLTGILFITEYTYAAKIDFKLYGKFIIEKKDAQGQKLGYQIWYVGFRRNLKVKDELPFTIFNSRIIDLEEGKESKYSVKNIYYWNYDKKKNILGLNDSVVCEDNFCSFELRSLMSDIYIKIHFYSDGTLRDITGTRILKKNPTKLIIYELVKIPIRIEIVEHNLFPDQKYDFKKRMSN